MSATAAGLAAIILLAGLASAEPASAGRLDDAGRALRAARVWVEPDLAWLVGPRQARSLARGIDRAGIALRVAILPQVEADESRGDPRAIARAIVRRVDRDGLYVLVDQDGRMTYAARDLPLELSEYALDDGSGAREDPVVERLRALVGVVAAAPASAPVSFEPFSHPKGVRTSGADNADSLVLIAVICALFGGVVGIGLHYLLRGVFAIAGARRHGGRA